MLPKKTQPRTGWKHAGWRNCQDVKIAGSIENAPRYLRCMRCYRLCTHGQLAYGGCGCGNRKLNPCLELTLVEMGLMKLGWFPLTEWERHAIRPIFPWLGVTVRPRVFRLVG